MTTPLKLRDRESRLRIETTAKGMLARLAHDLTILSQEIACDAKLDGADATISLRVPVRSLRVDGVRKRGVVDRGVLSSSDKAEIERKIRDEVLKSAEVVVSATVPGVPTEGARDVRTDATVEVGGKKARVELTATVSATAESFTAKGSAVVSLDALSIPPVKAPLGAFRVDDAIDVAFELAFDRA